MKYISSVVNCHPSKLQATCGVFNQISSFQTQVNIQQDEASYLEWLCSEIQRGASAAIDAILKHGQDSESNNACV